jgi:hypothetical protein
MPVAFGLPPRTTLSAPLIDVNVADALAINRTYYNASAHHSSYPARLQALGPARIPPPTSIAGIVARHPLREVLVNDMERPIQALSRPQTMAYAAGIGLASRLFEADHDRIPESLEELVPEYLPRLPTDPFDPNGGPLRYRVDAGVPIVWSVGPNGTDEGGRPVVGRGVTVNGWYQFEGPDLVILLRFPAHMDYKPLRWLLTRDGLLKDEPSE